ALPAQRRRRDEEPRPLSKCPWVRSFAAPAPAKSAKENRWPECVRSEFRVHAALCLVIPPEGGTPNSRARDATTPARVVRVFPCAAIRRRMDRFRKQATLRLRRRNPWRHEPRNTK